MADRDARAKEAAKHTALMKGAFAAEIAATAENAVIYEDGEGRELELPEEPVAEATETVVTTRFIPDAVYHEADGKIMVIDPVSFTRPGGNYESGAFGPEQIICSDSVLYPVLCAVKEEYHDKNRGYARGQLFTDRAILLPDVVFVRNGIIKKADVLGIPEPLRARALENHRPEQEVERTIGDRIEALLRIAAANQVDTLVLGAFACGRLGYEDAQIIELFQKWIQEHPGAIGKIVFAVPRFAFEAFDEAFGQPVEEKPVHKTADEEAEEEQEGFVLDFELPEGITLR